MSNECVGKPDRTKCGGGICIGGQCYFRVVEIQWLAACTDGQPCGYGNKGICVQGQCLYTRSDIDEFKLTIRPIE